MLRGAELDVSKGYNEKYKKTKIIYLEYLLKKDCWDLKFKKYHKFMRLNNFKFFKSIEIFYFINT